MDRGRNKKRRIGARLNQAVVDVWGREIGAITTRTFSHRLAASEVRLPLRRSIIIVPFCFSVFIDWFKKRN